MSEQVETEKGRRVVEGRPEGDRGMGVKGGQEMC